MFRSRTFLLVVSRTTHFTGQTFARNTGVAKRTRTSTSNAVLKIDYKEEKKRKKKKKNRVVSEIKKKKKKNDFFCNQDCLVEQNAS